MITRRKQEAIIRSGWLHVFILVASSFLLFQMLDAQDRVPNVPATAAPPAPSVPFFLTESPFIDFQTVQRPHAASGNVRAASAVLPVSSSNTSAPPGLPRKITLEEAQQAAAANSPMAKLGQLGVEAAHQHLLGAEADYLPKISALATNIHFNKFMGEKITIQRPVAGGTVTGGLPLAGKDQTLVSVSGAQPLTPIFKVQQEVNVARADQRTAMAKAGMPVEAAQNVEKNYYDLLVAQCELDIAMAKADAIRGTQLVASTAPAARALPGDTPESISAEKELVLAQSKVKELTVALNEMLGFSEETELELVIPISEREDITLKEAIDAATAANPEVVSAEGDLVKARAGQRLAKLDYVPDVAILGGYFYNGNAIPLLPRDFSYIGLLGSWNVFDFGKREHTIKERNAQVSEAGMALELTTAKVAGAVKSSYYEMDRSRQLSELAHRLSDAIPAERAGYSRDNQELAATRAKIEIETLQADLAYRKALANLKTLMGRR